MRVLRRVTCVGIIMAAGAAAAADGVWTNGSGLWNDASKWLNGVLPGPGDAAAFTGGGGTVTVPAGSPFTLSALLFNTNGADVAWTVAGETNTLVAPAQIRVDANTATLSATVTGSADITKTGNGILELTSATNFFSGKFTVSAGLLRSRVDGALGTNTDSLVTDAVTLSGGGLANTLEALTLSANRGVTIGPGNGWFLARAFTTATIGGPVTGPGSVFITRHNGTVVFANPANDYAGDTVLGADGVGAGVPGISSGILKLGADEVIPHGPGKGRLVFDGTRGGLLDLNGKTETVNGVAALGYLCLSNSAAQPGALKAGFDNGYMSVAGEVQTRATLEKIGLGTLVFADNGRSLGGLTVSSGLLAFSCGAAFGAATVTLDGGALVMTNRQTGLVESMAKRPDHIISLGADMQETGVRLTTAMGNTPVVGYPDYTQFGYKGQWYVPSAGLYSFAKNFDNSGYLAVDGVSYISNNVLSDVIVVRNVNLSAGWHTVDVRFSQGLGGVGPNVAGFTSGIMYDPANGPFTNAAEIAASAKRFDDPGDGSVLRTPELAGTNVVRMRLELAQNGTFDRSATAASLVWAGDVVAATNAVGTPVLTVAGGTEPFRMGTTNRFAVFGADVNDPNGIVFQDRVWLLSLPASSAWSIRPGADIAVGVPGLLGTGPMSLANFSVRIPSPDALGAGGETVTVEGTGNAVWFDATREINGMLLADSAYAFTASNNVVFNGAGARAGFDGAGTVTYTGAISGSGTLVKNGTGDAVLAAANSFSGNVQVNAGRLRVGDDAQLGDSANTVTLSGGYLGNSTGAEVTLARNVQVNAGGFDVQDAALTVNGVVSGTTVSKRGAGTLTLSGTTANAATLDLAMSAGTAVLDKSDAAAVRHVTGVTPGVTVRVAGTGGNQISGNVTLAGGTFDLNGRSETVGQLISTTVASVVTNGGSEASVLTVGEGSVTNVYFGAFADGLNGATLGLTKTGALNTFALIGGPAAQRYSGPTRVEAGTLEWGASVRIIRFAVSATRTAGQPPAVSEFQLLRDGVYVPCPADTVTLVSSQGSTTNGGDRLIDNNTMTKWLAATSAGQAFRIDLRRPMAVNGYRWYTASDGPERDPVSWTVEVSADGVTWSLVDSRTSYPTTGTRTMLAFSGKFAAPFAGGCAMAPGSAVTVSANALAQVFSMNEEAASFAGSGRLFLATGVALSAGDLSGFTGRLTGDGRLLAGTGGETAFSHLSSSPGQTIVNNGSAPLAVRVGGITNASFTASVRDGTGVAGLVKRGSQTVLLHGSVSAYTGDTRIEEGTLAVLPGTLSYRYVRFTPTEVRGFDPNLYPMAIAEFQLVRNGSVLAYPAGTTASSSGASLTPTYPPSRAIDGDINKASTNRWITGSRVFPNSLIVDMKQAVSFDGYQWYTASEAADIPRDPVSWKLEASQDGTAWVLLDVRVSEPVANVRNLAVGPYRLGGPAAVPPEFWAVTNSLQEKVAAVKARYLRFNPTLIRMGAYEFSGDGFQFAELQLLTNGAAVLYPAGTTATAPGDGFKADIRYFYPAYAVDNIPGDSSGVSRWYSPSIVNPLTVDMGQPVTFDGYRWFTGANGAGRDPVGWTLEISNNATNWYLVDVQTNWFGTLNRNAAVGPWTLDLLARGGASACAIPDASRTAVAAGAALRLDGASETVGPLSGAGAVALNGAALGINAFASTNYSGAVTGTGTVTKTGAAVQTLSGALSFKGSMAVDAGVLSLEGATLTGVTNIVIRSGGELAGFAAVNGNLTVTFEGGVYSGTLAMSDALTVVGDVAYGLPEGAELPYTRTLFTFGSADAATRAALAAGAASVPVPFGYAANVRVTSGAAYLSVAPPGMVLKLR